MHSRRIFQHVLLALILVFTASITGWSTPAQVFPSRGMPQGAADAVIRSMIEAVSPEELTQYVAELSGEQDVWIHGEPARILTRYSGTAGAGLAAGYLREHHEALGLDAAKWPYGTQGWVNVVATQPGLLHPEQVIIISAHYDSTSTDPDTYAPGADDNASGTAAVMMAADVLSRHRFAYTIRYVHFSGEEQGLYGSTPYAHQARLLGEELLGVINADMLAWNGDGVPGFDVHAGTFGSPSAELGKRLAGVVERYALPLDVDVRLDARAIRYSDHAPFWDEGFAALLAIQDWEDFNPYYHQPMDRMANFDMPYYTAAVQAIVGLAAEQAVPLPPPYPSPAPMPTPTPAATPACPPHLANGGFEDSPPEAGWTMVSSQGYPLIRQDRPHAGEWGAWLNQAPGTDDALCRVVHIPRGSTTPEIWFWWQMWTDEIVHGNDGLSLSARQVGEPAAPLTLWQMDDGGLQHLWNATRLPLDGFEGKTVELCFQGHSDPWRTTFFFLDDVQVTYCAGEAGGQLWLPLLRRP